VPPVAQAWPGAHAEPATGCVTCSAVRTGEIHPELAAPHHDLVSYERPTTALRWLDKSDAPAILRELGTHSPSSASCWTPCTQ
jgi:hypothetical protein